MSTIDPDQTLVDIRQLVTRILDADYEQENISASDAVELAEKFDALDEWLSNPIPGDNYFGFKGYLPQAWARPGGPVA